MNLTIFHEIIYGILEPQENILPDNYSEISHLLQDIPSTLPAIETALNKILGEKIKVNFGDDMPQNISQFLTNTNYTRIKLDYFEPEISLPLPQEQTPLQRFYFYIITAECKRIKLRLLQAVEILKDDICAKQEVINVLKLLARYARQIKEHKSPNTIFDFLLLQIIKLYYETTLIFDALLSNANYISISDFYSLRLNQQIDDITLSAYNGALHIHQTQQNFKKNINAQTFDLLTDLYSDLEKMPSDNILVAVICAIENAIFLQTSDSVIPPFSEIIDSNLIKLLLKDRKQIINDQLNALSNAREALIEIDGFIENLPDFPTISQDLIPLLTLSVARQLQSWLIEQRNIYKTNAAQAFIPTTRRENQTGKLKTAQQKMSPQQQKSKALKRISFLSGYNTKNEKIMPDVDFNRLVTYVDSLIDTGIVPKNITSISQTGVTNEFLRYTFYLIHKELFTTRPIRPEWIELLHATFAQFRDVETGTTRKKFSTKPAYYDEDIKEIGKQKKL